MPSPVPASPHPNPFGDLIIETHQFLLSHGIGIPGPLLTILAMVAACGAILGLISVTAMVLIYLERKVAGHIQNRVGPMHVGWHGVLQSIADGLKLLAKEDVVPDNANRFLFSFAPALVLAGALVPFAALPFTRDLVVANMDLGLFFILSFAALEVIGVIMAGWASNSKWSLYGGMRLAAQMMSYEIPLGLSILTVVILAGTLNMNTLAEQQSTLPYMLQSPFAFVAFFIFYIAGLANAKRAPFDLPEAESELVSGFHTEYSGMRFSFFFLAEYAAMALISAIGALVFMGGWNWPINAASLPLIALLQLGIKVFALLFLMIWLRWTLPRVRIDQVMHMCLKVLLPLGMICVVGAGIEAVTGQHLLFWVIFAALCTVFVLVGRHAQRKITAQL